jgi:hypothetical protein
MIDPVPFVRQYSLVLSNSLSRAQTRVSGPTTLPATYPKGQRANSSPLGTDNEFEMNFIDSSVRGRAVFLFLFFFYVFIASNVHRRKRDLGTS